MNPEQILNALEAFIQTDNLAKKQAVVNQHPELLTKATQEVGQILLEEFENEDERQFITMHLFVLQICQEVGVNVKTAFKLRKQARAVSETAPASQDSPRHIGKRTRQRAKKLISLIRKFIEVDTLDKQKQFVEQNPILLSDEIQTIFDELIQRATDTNEEDVTIHFFRQRKTLLQQCRKYGIETGFSEHSEQIETLLTLDKFISLIHKLDIIDTIHEKKQFVEQNLILLSDELQTIFENLIQLATDANDKDVIRVFRKHKILLQLCREHGIETAFAELREEKRAKTKERGFGE